MAFEPRFYRDAMRPEGLVSFRVVVAETDLLIHAESDLSAEAAAEVRRLRRDLEGYLASHPRFAESFVPVPADGRASRFVAGMAIAASAAGVGPMASVAGAFAEAVARTLSAHSAEVIVENGGDLYLMGRRECTVGLWAGEGSPVSLGIRIGPERLPCAVATSSGTIGPSISMGSADAATVIARNGALADAAASAVGNRVHGPDDLEAAIGFGRAIEGVEGLLLMAGGATAAWGAIELVPLSAGVL